MKVNVTHQNRLLYGPHDSAKDLRANAVPIQQSLRLPITYPAANLLLPCRATSSLSILSAPPCLLSRGAQTVHTRACISGCTYYKTCATD